MVLSLKGFELAIGIFPATQTRTEALPDEAQVVVVQVF